MSEFECVCDSIRLKINVGKSKVLTIKKNQMGNCENVGVNGKEMQEVDKFNYLGVMISKGDGMGRKWFTGYLGDDGKVVEGEHDIQRSKTGVI